eukprot:7463411-Alexandrium_andersonii.AAC.1
MQKADLASTNRSLLNGGIGRLRFDRSQTDFGPAPSSNSRRMAWKVGPAGNLKHRLLMCVAEKPPDLIGRGTDRARAGLRSSENCLVDFDSPITKRATRWLAINERQGPRAGKHQRGLHVGTKADREDT